MQQQRNALPAWSIARRRARVALVPVGLAVAILLSLLGALYASRALAQEELGSYTVQSGDTLAEIAERFGVSIEQLIAINEIADRNLIAVGQILLIPSADDRLNVIPSQQVIAQPGDTLIDIARRYEQDPVRLTALNQMSMTARLFPGQPVVIPVGVQIDTPLRFGLVESISAPTELIQGRTGQLAIQSRRPISIVATWNGLPLTLLPAYTQPAPLTTTTQTAVPPTGERTGQAQRVVSLLPVPALIAPSPYTLTVGYTTTSGVFLHQDRQIIVVAGPYDSQEIVLPDEKGGLLAPEIVDSELVSVTTVWSTVTPQWWWTEPFSRPIGSQYATTSPFGTRRSYNGGPYNSYHAGQDFGAPEGVPVLAPAAGRVALAEPLQVRGNAVLLDHGGGIFTGYWHLSDLYVVAGQMVNQGDVLGLVGTTGLSTGAHLHWELRIYGIGVDPMQFLTAPLLAP